MNMNVCPVCKIPGNPGRPKMPCGLPGCPIGEEFAGMSDDQLRDYECSLYDDEVNKTRRERVVIEMNRRGMMDRRSDNLQLRKKG